MHACSALILVVHIMIHIMQSSIARKPFMDELYHAGQFWEWLQGNYRYYDPMITTPPGLYLLPLLLFSNGMQQLAKIWWLRAVNVLYALIIDLSTINGRLIISHPMVLFYGALYYTDIGSLAFILLYMRALRKNQAMVSLVAGWLALLFRQTSIVWIGFAFLLHLHRTAKTDSPSGYLYALKKSKRQCMSTAIHAVTFLLFMHWNQGIVIGDRANHVPTLHIPQLFYCCSLCLLINWPSLPSIKAIFKRHWRPIHALWLCPIILAIHYCTVEHPYLLTDYRHLTNLFWRKFMTREEVRLSLGLFLYLPCMFIVYKTVQLKHGATMAIVFMLATAAVVIPTPLIEPRYYIVPSVVHLMLAGTKKRQHVQLLWNGMLATLLFLPFWLGRDGDYRYIL